MENFLNLLGSRERASERVGYRERRFLVCELTIVSYFSGIGQWRQLDGSKRFRKKFLVDCCVLVCSAYAYLYLL